MTAFVMDLSDYWGERPGVMTPTWARLTCLTDPWFVDSVHRKFVERMSAKTFYERFGRVWQSGCYVPSLAAAGWMPFMSLDALLDWREEQEGLRENKLLLNKRPHIIDADEGWK